MIREHEDAITDEELTAAAVTLATLDYSAPLPARLRERVEASGRNVLGQRAKEHAWRRAGAGSAASTTSAGTQVIVAIDRSSPARRRRPFYAWGGATAFALAAAVILLMRSRLPAPPASAAGVTHDVERIALGDARGARGELRYDRGDGTGVLTVGEGMAVESEILELWITFEGDAAPRPVAIFPPTSREVAFGIGQPLCRPVPGPSCAPVQEVFITRESRQGTLTFVVERAALRGRATR